jgi:hypothetical protein
VCDLDALARLGTRTGVSCDLNALARLGTSTGEERMGTDTGLASCTIVTIPMSLLQTSCRKQQSWLKVSSALLSLPAPLWSKSSWYALVMSSCSPYHSVRMHVLIHLLTNTQSQRQLIQTHSHILWAYHFS